MMSFARVRPHTIRDLRGNAGGAELVRDRIALRTGRDDQLAPAKVAHMAWACHGGGHIDHGSCHRLLTQHLAQALVVVHAVLQAQYLGVRCQVGFDLCGRCFGVGGFHAEQHHIGARHGTGFGAGGDGMFRSSVAVCSRSPCWLMACICDALPISVTGWPARASRAPK
jgi:hypothetical protein